MGNFIAENRAELSESHYIRKAGAQHYWFDFSYNVLEKYKDDHGNQFCLIIYGSEVEDDAYIMPYSAVETLFRDGLLDDRKRWIGTVKNNIINLGSGNSMSVSEFYNRFDLLDNSVKYNNWISKDNSAVYGTGDEIDKSAIKMKIEEFNKKYRNTKPSSRQTISNQIARPGPITDYLKELQNYTCQICRSEGFIQANGTRYIEAHHIIELHKLVEGSYCSDNIVIVCPTCHRKLHYAKVVYTTVDSNKIQISINDKTYSFTRTILTSSL